MSSALILYSQAVKDPLSLPYENGTFLVYGHDSFELPDCLPARTDVVRTYTVGDGLPPDTYVGRLTFNVDPNGCGQLTVR